MEYLLIGAATVAICWTSFDLWRLRRGYTTASSNHLQRIIYANQLRKQFEISDRVYQGIIDGSIPHRERSPFMDPPLVHNLFDLVIAVYLRIIVVVFTAVVGLVAVNLLTWLGEAVALLSTWPFS